MARFVRFPKPAVRCMSTEAQYAHPPLSLSHHPPPVALPTSFRTSFDLNAGKLSWYPGHMAQSMRRLKDGLAHIDIVLEVRDARIPLSSTNWAFERVLQGRDRMIIYNKADLANPNMQQAVVNTFKQYKPDPVLFTSAKHDHHVKQIIQFGIDKVRIDPQRYPYVCMVVVGMPNVGKSSLINSLRRMGVRKGKVAAVAPHAGVTQAIATRVKVNEDPPVYVVDTPGTHQRPTSSFISIEWKTVGIFNPEIRDPIQGLKIALTGGTKDRLTNQLVVADYLLFVLNRSPSRAKYVEHLGLSEPTDSIIKVLQTVGTRYKLFYFNTPRIEEERAAQVWINMFRDGSLGRFTLDPVQDLKAYLEYANTYGL